MSDQDSTIFHKEEQPKSVEQQPANPTDQGKEKSPVSTQPNYDELFREHLSSIKNDKGEQKYNDVFTALSALKHSQDYVKTLEQENAQYRDQVTRQRSFDDVLDEITTKRTQENTTVSNQGLDVESVRGVTLELLKEYEQQKVAMANQKSVVESLASKYGSAEKAEEVYKNKAKELGLSTQFLDNLAATSPKSVLYYFDAKETAPQVKNTHGSINTEALRTTTQETQWKPRDVMSGPSDTKDLLYAWRAAGESVMNKYGDNK